MIVTTEQSFTKLKFLDKPIDEYTDEELDAKVQTLRTARSKITTKTRKTPTSKAPKTKPEISADDIS